MDSRYRGSFLWVFLLLISIVYILNPGMGLFEFIPDTLPVIGNLDEAGTVLLILKSLVELNVLPRKILGCFLDLYDKPV